MAPLNALLRGAALLLLLSQAASQQEPCAKVSGAFNADPPRPVTPGQISACLNSFPFSPTIARGTLDTLTKALQAYVFLGSTNLLSTLQGMANKTYLTERAFHDAVRAAFVSVGDTHLTYDSGCFHAPFDATLGLPLTVVQRDNGSSYVMVVPDLEPTNALWPGVNVSSFARATVSQINGVDPLTVLRFFASNPTDPVARDWGARFNLAIAHQTFGYSPQVPQSYVFSDPGSYSYRAASIPAANILTLTLQRVGSATSEKVNVPWAVHYSGSGFGATAAEFYAAHCMNPPEASQLNVKGRAARMLQDSKLSKAPFAASRRRLVTGVTPLVTKILQAHMLPDGITGVLVVPTFDLNPLPTFNAVRECLSALIARNATRLIIDFRGNKGGKVNSGFHLVNALFPRNRNPSPRFVFSGSRYAQRLVLSSFQSFTADMCRTLPGCRYFYGTWLDDGFQPITKYYDFFFPVSSMIVPVPPFTRLSPGFATIPVSQPFRQKFVPQTAALDQPPFKASSIVMLSDGSCQSTCAMVVYILRRSMGVRLAFIGGARAGNPDIASAAPNAAGGVVSLDELITQEIQILQEQEEDHHPKPLPVPGQLRFPIRAALQNGNTSEPSKTSVDAFEFLPLAPQFRIFNTLDVALDVEAAWTRATAAFI